MPADVSELEALGVKMKAAGVRVRREQRKVVKETTERVAEAMSDFAPEGPTGDLKDSMEPKVRGMKGTVTSTSRYAQFVNYGTYKDDPQPFAEEGLEAGTAGYLDDSEAAAIRALSVF